MAGGLRHGTKGAVQCASPNAVVAKKRKLICRRIDEYINPARNMNFKRLSRNPALLQMLYLDAAKESTQAFDSVYQV